MSLNKKTKFYKTEEKEFSDIEIEIDDFYDFNQKIFNEINYARQFPEEYVLILEDILKTRESKDENFLFMENVPFVYNDLYGSLTESIKFLKAQKKLPGFVYHQALSDACEELLYEYVHNQNYKNNNNIFEKRINHYGQSFGDNYELINYDMFDPEFIVVNMILSDGERDKFQRKVIFNPNLKYIGLCFGFITPSKVCTIINCCEDFFGIDEHVPIEIQNQSKTIKKNYYSKIIDSKKSKNIIIEVPDVNAYKLKKSNNKKTQKTEKIKEDNNVLRGKYKNNNIILRKQPSNNDITKNIFDYDLENFDEEEFFEKEFDTNYGKVEKDKNSNKKMFTTTTTTEDGTNKTIITTIVENVDNNGVKRGYYIEKEQKNVKKYINENIEKEKKDMKKLKMMERKEKERLEREKNKKKIKEIPIKLKGKKAQMDEIEYGDEEQTEKEEYQDIPEGATGMQITKKTITDSNGEPALEITKTITYEDGSVQKLIDKQPLETI